MRLLLDGPDAGSMIALAMKAIRQTEPIATVNP